MPIPRSIGRAPVTAEGGDPPGAAAGVPLPLRRVRNRDVLAGVAMRTAATMAHRGGHARALLKSIWIELKRYGAAEVGVIPVREVEGLAGLLVEGDVLSGDRLVLCAVARLVECRQVFEFGTYHGDTAWLLAHNLPESRIFTLDLPDAAAASTVRLELTDRGQYFNDWGRGVRFAGTAEAARITPLSGDSASFDFSPFRSQMDLVFVDASHSYSYVRSDTEAALQMLSPQGTIVWDDYTHYAGIYQYLNELAPRLDQPLVHLLNTRLAVYSRSPRFRVARERVPDAAGARTTS